MTAPPNDPEKVPDSDSLLASFSSSVRFIRHPGLAPISVDRSLERVAADCELDVPAGAVRIGTGNGAVFALQPRGLFLLRGAAGARRRSCSRSKRRRAFHAALRDGPLAGYPRAAVCAMCSQGGAQRATSHSKDLRFAFIDLTSLPPAATSRSPSTAW